MERERRGWVRNGKRQKAFFHMLIHEPSYIHEYLRSKQALGSSALLAYDSERNKKEVGVEEKLDPFPHSLLAIRSFFFSFDPTFESYTLAFHRLAFFLPPRDTTRDEFSWDRLAHCSGHIREIPLLCVFTTLQQYPLRLFPTWVWVISHELS